MKKQLYINRELSQPYVEVLSTVCEHFKIKMKFHDESDSDKRVALATTGEGKQDAVLFMEKDIEKYRYEAITYCGNYSRFVDMVNNPYNRLEYYVETLEDNDVKITLDVYHNAYGVMKYFNVLCKEYSDIFEINQVTKNHVKSNTGDVYTVCATSPNYRIDADYQIDSVGGNMLVSVYNVFMDIIIKENLKLEKDK